MRYVILAYLKTCALTITVILDLLLRFQFHCSTIIPRMLSSSALIKSIQLSPARSNSAPFLPFTLVHPPHPGNLHPPPWCKQSIINVGTPLNRQMGSLPSLRPTRPRAIAWFLNLCNNRLPNWVNVGILSHSLHCKTFPTSPRFILYGCNCNTSRNPK